ncbi:hypothetical protein BV25DRAFT_1825333 [Artomyces pyxidatus]|uniref:Uncharacterized protein n=1 Tax=Artomyces pyxidatus TaxID=48021 RepID=A0ACB8T272_9AGAM|nr:hypothetical protein BV25DRAFT_1825333 [Artomyces pyxidatus]
MLLPLPEVFVCALFVQLTRASPVAASTTPIPTNGTVPFALVLSGPPSTCTDIEICRTRYNIIWSSLVTVLACVWTAVHRNVPGPSKPDESRLQHTVSRVLEGTKIVVITLLVPEWVLAWAVRQFLNARKVRSELEAARKTAEDEWERNRALLQRIMKRETVERSVGRPSVSSEHAAAEGEEDKLIGEEPSAGPGESEKSQDEQMELDELTTAVDDRAGRLRGKWTIRHGFFVIMGGFHYYENGDPKHPLSRFDVVKLVEAGALVPPTEDEIRGWSQGDALSKGLAVVQTLWFVIQCIARRVEGLPITQLEVMTLAYTTITVAMYAFWWSKPQNIGSPVRVAVRNLPVQKKVEGDAWIGRFLAVVGGGQDVLTNLRREPKVPTFYGGSADGSDNDIFADIIALTVAMVFGVVHCAAWNYTFPSRVEEVIWRVSSIAIVAVPGALMFSVSALVMDILDSQNSVLTGAVAIVMTIIFILSAPIYIGARTLLFAVSFTTLRSLPYEAY